MKIDLTFTGQDLSWFWRSWFFNDWKLDHAVRLVEYTGGDCSKGVNITIANNDKMVMPVVVEIRRMNGMVERVQVPAQVWLDKSIWTFHYPSTSAVSVLLDPDGHFPDQDKAGYRVYLEDSTSQVNSLDAYIVNVTNPAGDHWRYYYDRMSWLKVRQERVGAEAPGMPAGPMDYFDYRSEQGLLAASFVDSKWSG